MTEIINAIMPFIPQSAIPVVIVVLGGLYIYRKIDSQRKETKAVRDEDSREIREKLQAHDFEIANLKGSSGHHSEVLDDLREQINILNVNLVKNTVTIENLGKVVEKLGIELSEKK